MLRLFLGLYLFLALGFAGAMTAVQHIFINYLAADLIESYNRDAVSYTHLTLPTIYSV